MSHSMTPALIESLLDYAEQALRHTIPSVSVPPPSSNYTNVLVFESTALLGDEEQIDCHLLEERYIKAELVRQTISAEQDGEDDDSLEMHCD
jgi:hypothetical protein